MKSKVALSSVIIASIIAVTTTLPADLSLRNGMTAYSAEASSEVQIHPSFSWVTASKLRAYNQVFKIPTENIFSITANGSEYSRVRGIDKAIDEDYGTFWETAKPNSATFKNQIEVTFKQPQTFNRMTYATRRDVSTGKGFPRAFEIYSSSSASGDDYQLVGKGTFETVNRNTMEYRFRTLTANRIKFVFVDAEQSWPSASEIAFYKQDPLLEKIDDLFTDGTMVTVTPAYANTTSLNQLAEQAESHPLRESLLNRINLAKNTIDQPEQNHPILTLPQNGDSVKQSRETLRMISFGSNFISTGVVATPGETFKVYVDAIPNRPLPKIAFTQQEGAWSNWNRIYELKPGENTFYVPVIYNKNWSRKSNPGGAVYFINPYTPDQQGKAPKIRIVGGEKFPVFNSGDNVGQFMEQLKVYKQKLDANPESMIDIMEINMDKLIFTGTATSAYDVFVNKQVNPQDTVRTWDTIINDMFLFAGIDGRSPEHDGSNARSLIRLMQPHGSMYAGMEHVGIQRPDLIEFLNPSLLHRALWGNVHEFGHQMDMHAMEWVEISNNMWSNFEHIKYGFSDLVYYQSIFENQAPDLYQNTQGFYNYGFFNGLAMFWQLQIKNNNYWSGLQSLHRERKPAVTNEQQKRDLLILYSSEVMGVDLTEYFDRYKFTLSEEGKTKMKALNLPALTQKLWYLHTPAYQYKGEGFHQEYKPVINQITTVNNQVKLTYSIADEAKGDLLGYEIIRDGKVIGFSKDSTFIDKTAAIGQIYQYSIVAYDHLLKPSLTSNHYEKQTAEPTITVAKSVTIPVGAAFNPLSKAVAQDAKGNDITGSIVVTHSDVNQEKIGTYQVTYEVMDEQGYKTSATIEVIVENVTYASDLQWISATSSYGQTKKDQTISGKTIKLKNELKVIEYPKGIGTHANSTVVYHVDGKNFQSFEAAIGVEQSIPDNRNSSIVFEVYVDNVKAYDSGLMKYATPEKHIKVNIAGAREIKLVVNDGGNGIGSDHAAWGDAKFVGLSASEPQSAPPVH